MSRVCVYPGDHWTLPVETPYSMGVRERELIVLGGQVAMDPGGTVLHPHNVSDQIEGTLDRVESILGEMDAALSDARQLVLYYVTDGSVDETPFRQRIAKRFGAAVPPTLSLVPLPYMAYPGLSAEIDVYAMRSEDGSVLDRQSGRRERWFPTRREVRRSHLHWRAHRRRRRWGNAPSGRSRGAERSDFGKDAGTARRLRGRAIGRGAAQHLVPSRQSS